MAGAAETADADRFAAAAAGPRAPGVACPVCAPTMPPPAAPSVSPGAVVPAAAPAAPLAPPAQMTVRGAKKLGDRVPRAHQTTTSSPASASAAAAAAAPAGHSSAALRLSPPAAAAPPAATANGMPEETAARAASVSSGCPHWKSCTRSGTCWTWWRLPSGVGSAWLPIPIQGKGAAAAATPVDASAPAGAESAPMSSADHVKLTCVLSFSYERFNQSPYPPSHL